MSEEWKDIKGYGGLYQVSNWGRVRSLDRVISDICHGSKRKRLFKGKILRQGTDPDGYKQVMLSKDGEETTKKVHHLVLSEFIGMRPKSGVCRHLNGDRVNNYSYNLEWGTPQENSADMKLHGNNCYGERQGNSKLTEKQVLEIKADIGYRNNPKLAKRYNVSTQAIWDIKHHKRWKYLDETSEEVNELQKV